MKLNSSQNTSVQSGFTLIELLIFLSIVVVLITSFLSIISGIFRSQQIGDREEVIQNAFVSVMSDITQEIQWSTSAVLSDTGPTDRFELTKEDLSGTEVTSVYRVVDGVLLKNDQALTPSSVRVTDFNIESIGLSASLPLLRIQVGMEMPTGNPQRLDEVITISMRDKEIK